MWLKQSTAVTIKLGPFVNSTDGFTANTTLTISQADIRLSKNGGAYAQTNNAAGATHDEGGEYGVPLDATDTNTLGRLKVRVHESGALPVWAEFMVVPANVYDSMILGSDKLDINVAQVSEDTTAADNLEAAFDGTGYAFTGCTLPWTPAWDAEVQSEVQDALEVNNLHKWLKNPITSLAADADPDSFFGKLVNKQAGSWTWAPTSRSLEKLGDLILTDTAAIIAAMGALTAAERNAIADALLARVMTEGYAADGATATVAQMFYMIWAAINEFLITGTTLRAKKLDGSTTAMEWTLDSATAPTSRTRSL